MRGWARLRRSTRGIAMIEFALIMPILVLLLTGVLDLGVAGYDLRLVQAAAESGAAYADSNQWNSIAIAAIVTGSGGAHGITATPAPMELCACPDGGTLTQATCGGTCPSGNPVGTYALVSAQMQYVTTLPYPGLPAQLMLTAKAYRKLH